MLAHDNCQLQVDVTLAALPTSRPGALLQCIGELRWKPGAAPQLVARIWRSCEGLDVCLYEKVLAVRRDFEASAPVAV